MDEENAPSVPEHHACYFQCRQSLLEFCLAGRSTGMWMHWLLLGFWGNVRNPRFITCDDLVQKFVSHSGSNSRQQTSATKDTKLGPTVWQISQFQRWICWKIAETLSVSLPINFSINLPVTKVFNIFILLTAPGKFKCQIHTQSFKMFQYINE